METKKTQPPPPPQKAKTAEPPGSASFRPAGRCGGPGLLPSLGDKRARRAPIPSGAGADNGGIFGARPIRRSGAGAGTGLLYSQLRGGLYPGHRRLL